MIKNSKKWLERETKEWVSKGWISAEAEKHICQAYRTSDEQTMGISLYGILAVVGSSIVGMALIWARPMPGIKFPSSYGRYLLCCC